MHKKTIQNQITIDDVMKVHNSSGVGFVPMFCIRIIGVHFVFPPIRRKLRQLTPKHVQGNAKYNMYYYRQSYCFPENLKNSKTKS